MHGAISSMRPILRYLLPSLGFILVFLIIFENNRISTSNVDLHDISIQYNESLGPDSDDIANLTINKQAEYEAQFEGGPIIIEFYPPKASIQHNVVRGDNLLWTSDKGISWQSISRQPNQPECWTYLDRIKRYRNFMPDWYYAVRNNNKNNASRRAIILRVGADQLWKFHFTVHVRALVLEAGYLGKYDIIILVHLDLEGEARAKYLRKIPSEFQPLVQVVSTSELRDWLPEEAKFTNISQHGHVAIQRFMALNPFYDFVYSLEPHVRLIGRWDKFLADIDYEYAFHHEKQTKDQSLEILPDLVTFESLRRPETNSSWLEDECLKHFGGLANTRAALGAMWGWSRRLTDALTKANHQGVNCYSEYFVPSTAYKANLTTFFYQHPLYCPRYNESDQTINSIKSSDRGRNDPKLVQFYKVPAGCTYYTVNSTTSPFWIDWVKHPEICRPPALIHPITGDTFN